MTAAIVADDLTGALDAAAPFAARGLRTAVTIDASSLEQAVAADAAIIAVNTGSRALAANAAADLVFDAAKRLSAYAPPIAFKKVDSRLKGQIAAEIDAALAGFNCDGAVLCPAIPEFGRFVTNAMLHGAGIDAPISIRALCADPRVAIADADSAAALCAIAKKLRDGERRLAVGARGFANALANLLSAANGRDRSPIRLSPPILIAIGSLDPITRRQIEWLTRLLPAGDAIAAPNGAVANEIRRSDVTLIYTTAATQAESADAVACRFADGVARAARARPPASLILSGGETAEAVVRALEFGALIVEGEAEPGVVIARSVGATMKIAAKSGGFGDPQTLARLIGAAFA